MAKILNCEFLRHGLHFTPDSFRCCCAPQHGITLDIRNMKIDDAYRLFQQKRENAIADLNINIPNEKCLGCIYLKEYDSEYLEKDYFNNPEKKDLVNYIVINHFKHCDCICTYCSQGIFLRKVNWPTKSDYYDLLPVIKKFYKENLIDKENLTVEFQGGSIGVLREFDDLVKIFMKNGLRKAMFYTNGLKFMPAIVKASQKAECLIICSVDAGTPETFKKLKPQGKFEAVIGNLKKYAKQCRLQRTDRYIFTTINAKYILIEGVNDSIEEVSKFLEIIASTGVNMSQLDMDFRKIMIAKGVHYDVPKHYYEIFEFFKKRAPELGITPFVWEYTQNILDKGYFE